MERTRRTCAEPDTETQAMPYGRHSPQEVASRGEEIYEKQIRAQVEAGNKGKFVVIDVETGEFEVDEDDLRATQRMLARQPDAVLYGLRIGYPTAYTLGGHLAEQER